MGWYTPWVPGADHGSYPSRLYKDRSDSEKEVQICPNFRAS